jgi:D-alanyl-D-alanine carboxypeptidase
MQLMKPIVASLIFLPLVGGREPSRSEADAHRKTSPGIAVPVAPQVAHAPALDSAIRAYAKKHEFSGAILVERGGKTIYHQPFGLADRAFSVPVSLDTRFKIASITKSFTAVLILQLLEQGKLELHTPIRRYLPNYKGEGANGVTVHHLLNHTSGIENFDQVKTYEEAVSKGIPAYQLPHTSTQLLDEFSSGKLVREAGKTFEYNNADYIILGKIIESVTGKTFDEVLRERILGPLGMSASGVLYQEEIVPRLAPSYMRVADSKGPINDMPVYPQNWFAAGAMYSTTGDLRKFAQALYGGGLLQPESVELMLAPGLDEYGYGLWVRSVPMGAKETRVAQRPGQIMGANTLLLRYFDDDVTVIILSNTNLTDIDAFGFFIGKTVLQ